MKLRIFPLQESYPSTHQKIRVKVTRLNKSKHIKTSGQIKHVEKHQFNHLQCIVQNKTQQVAMQERLHHE